MCKHQSFKIFDIFILAGDQNRNIFVGNLLGTCWELLEKGTSPRPHVSSLVTAIHS